MFTLTADAAAEQTSQQQHVAFYLAPVGDVNNGDDTTLPQKKRFSLILIYNCSQL
jgi:hypothetical protein